MISGSWFLYNSAQILAFLAAFGFALCLWRMRVSDHRAHLIAFSLMLFGAMARELVVVHYGPVGWPEAALFWSSIARCFKIAGALLFVRAITIDRCGEWVWLAVFAAALVVAAIVP